MNYSEDPFSADSQLSGPTALKQQLTEQDIHLDHLHTSLQQVRHQTDALHAELREHNDLLSRLSTQMDSTEGSFEGATRRVRKLYTELTGKQFNWTATALILVLSVLLIVLLCT